MTVSAEDYLAVVTETIGRVAASQREAVGRAADLIAEAVRADGVVHAFGTGHSEALAMEIAGRAGGLVPTNRIALRDLVLLGGEPAERLGPLLERDPAVAHRLYELAPVRPTDVFVLASNSGVNGAMVEFATLVKERGHGLVAITSAQHSGRMTSRHPSGRKLGDIADVVLDNGAPYGDATLPAARRWRGRRGLLDNRGAAGPAGDRRGGGAVAGGGGAAPGLPVGEHPGRRRAQQ